MTGGKENVMENLEISPPTMSKHETIKKHTIIKIWFISISIWELVEVWL
jgi:hypothetical protein